MKTRMLAGAMGALLWGTAATAAAGQEVAPTVPAAGAAPQCELHVWPTENYLGVNTGLLSGFGLVGAVADMGVHADKVKSVKELMRDYLGPEVQLAELNRVGIENTLGLKGYKMIVHEPTPFNEDVKKDPALKAKTKVMNAKLKGGQRLSDSTASCYAELVGTMIFYHKAMMYGSNLFGGWVYREFPATGLATRSNAGAVKNPLEHFPPKTPDKVEAAKAELRDAYAKSFVEYVQKKVPRTATK